MGLTASSPRRRFLAIPGEADGGGERDGLREPLTSSNWSKSSGGRISERRSQIGLVPAMTPLETGIVSGTILGSRRRLRAAKGTHWIRSAFSRVETASMMKSGPGRGMRRDIGGSCR